MDKRRIESTQSRTADITCGCRAAFWMEKRPAFKSYLTRQRRGRPKRAHLMDFVRPGSRETTKTEATKRGL